MFCVGISAVGTSVAAGAPLASDNDNPAAPNNGTAQARLFRFETCFARDMTEYSFGQMIEHRYRGETLAGLDQFLMPADRALVRWKWPLLARSLVRLMALAPVGVWPRQPLSAAALF